ncbi:MAG: thiamine pyrophosphate-dependent dehydrogenase E1 component subunit alpha [Candidatus Omnitrophica bacterium]|nr:thiamine pyrophosphate-dependent dehydrogenase E1 component subunit alpha [Candidatus Omnitrophota bacterium]
MDKKLFRILNKYISTVDKKTSLSLFKNMLRIRMVEGKIAELYPEGKMRCPTHLYTGEEAVASGVCENLKPSDYVFSSYRSHGAYLAKGGSIKKLFAELYGKKTGCSRGKGGSMHIVSRQVNFMGTSALVGGVMPIAAGTALASDMKKDKRVSIVFFGDGACEEGIFQETLNFAALKKLPIIFICENNFYATYSHQLTRQARDNIYKRVAIYGIPGVRIDGNNVLEVFRTSKKLINEARRGRGPAFIECRTYRWLEHVGPYFDLEAGYRTKEEMDKWIDRCPLSSFGKVLLKKKMINPEAINSIKRSIEADLEKAVLFAEKSPFPGCSEIYEGVYNEQ